MHERIGLILRLKNFTQKEFADRIGKSPQYINSITTGKGSIGLDLINHLVDIFDDINLNWLIRNKGEKFIKEVNNYEVKESNDISIASEPYGNGSKFAHFVIDSEKIEQQNKKILQLEKEKSHLEGELKAYKEMFEKYCKNK